jgi:two-component system cell cycle response regulator
VRHQGERKSWPIGGSQRWVPLLFGLGIGGQFVGQALYTLYEQLLHQTFPFPSWADAGYLSAYPFLLLGILCLPTRSLSVTSRSRVLLDGLMIMIAAVTFSWYFILGPTMMQGGGTLFAKIVGAAYPFWDLVLIFCILLLSLRSADAAVRPVLWLLSLALLIIVFADSLLDYQSLQGAYTTGSLFDVCWPLGYMLVGLAAQMLCLIEQRQAAPPDPQAVQDTRRPRSNFGYALLPYGLVPAVLILTVLVSQRKAPSALELGVYLSSAVLIGIVLFRQIFVLHETSTYATYTAHLNADLHQANALLERLSTTDLLTELPNQRALLDTLEQEAARARRNGRELSVLFFDADHFKRVNDTHGHNVGDVVLRELGGRVRGQLRGGDILGRYGGEEFLVLLPETALDEACEVAERVRRAVAVQPLAAAIVPDGIPTTVSLGVATFPVDGATAGEVVERADQAMYWAKRLGRNQVRSARDAVRLNRDEALAATVSQLERLGEPSADGVSLEQVVRAKQLTTIQSLMWLLDLRDRSIFTHCAEVSDLAGAMARDLGESEAAIFATTTAALLHDLGKIALPDGLLSKAGPLTPAERGLIRQHPALGAQILEVSPFLHHLMPAVQHHHENWDGSGYPDGLAGENIPRAARIIRVAEAYQAMTTDRPYQRHRSGEEARTELLRCAGTHFDPAIVEAALRVLSSGKPAMNEATSRPASSSSGERARPGEGRGPTPDEKSAAHP